MDKIDAEFIRTHLIRAGIEAEFVNFNPRVFVVRVKQKSFKFLRQHYRGFSDKLIDSQDFEIPVLKEFMKRFDIKRLRSRKIQREMRACEHSDSCDHTIYDLVSFLGDKEGGEAEPINLEDLRKLKSFIEGPKESPPLELDNKEEDDDIEELGNVFNQETENLSHKCNNELRDKLRMLDYNKARTMLVFVIPHKVQDYMICMLFSKLKTFKHRFFSNKFVEDILIKIDFKQVKVSVLHSNFFTELIAYLDKFFQWNMQYHLFLDHAKVLRDLYISLSLDIKKLFYDFFLKKPKLDFNKRLLFLMMYLMNEVRQFRWSFIQIFGQLLDYAACKSN